MIAELHDAKHDNDRAFQIDLLNSWLRDPVTCNLNFDVRFVAFDGECVLNLQRVNRVLEGYPSDLESGCFD